MIMQSQNRFFEDFSKVVNGAVGTLAGVGREAEGALRERFREFMGGFDFVSRDEFDAVKAMAAAARDEVEELKARLEALRSEEHTSEIPSLMRISYAVFCLKKKTT